MRFAGGSPLTIYSLVRLPMSFLENPFTSDREALALPLESCVL
jgi:hypothetical protein